MPRYIACVAHWTIARRDANPGDFVAKAIATPLAAVGALLLANGVLARHITEDVTQVAVGLLCLGAAAVLATRSKR